MATSVEVGKLADGIQDKTEYRGNVQVIPVTIASLAASTTYDVSVVLPQNTVVVGVNIDSAAQGGGTLALGTNVTADAIFAATDVTSAVRLQFPDNAKGVGSVQVGGEILQLVSGSGGSGGSVGGYILIATQE